MHRQFNTYKDGIDLAFLREYCMERGELRQYRRGEAFVVAGERQHGIGLVEQGFFKYAVNNAGEGKEYITGFAFEDEFVADFPRCILHQPACVSVIALTNCKVYQIDGQKAARHFSISMQHAATASASSDDGRNFWKIYIGNIPRIR